MDYTCCIWVREGVISVRSTKYFWPNLFFTFREICFCLLLYVASNNNILSVLLYQFTSKVKRKAKYPHACGYTISETVSSSLHYFPSWPGAQLLPRRLSFKCLTSLQRSFWATCSKCLALSLSLPSFSPQWEDTVRTFLLSRCVGCQGNKYSKVIRSSDTPAQG